MNVNPAILAAPLELSAAEVARYSLNNAIQGIKGGGARGRTFEREITVELARRAGKPEPEPDRALIPPQILASNRRDLTVASAAGGGYLVDTKVGGLIDVVRPTSVVLRNGAQRVTGLRSNATYARQGGTVTIGWQVNEATQATETATLSLGSVALAPKTAFAYIERSHLMSVTAPDISEFMTRNDMRRGLATAIDAMALNGPGVSGQPTGILNSTGIGTFNGGTIAWADILEAQTDILTSNSLSAGGEGQITFVCRPATASVLASRQGFSSTDPIWRGPLQRGTVAGNPAQSTMNMPAATLLAVDFAQVMVAEWSAGIEIRVNPYANFAAGIDGYLASVAIDVAVMVPSAASAATSVS